MKKLFQKSFSTFDLFRQEFSHSPFSNLTFLFYCKRHVQLLLSFVHLSRKISATPLSRATRNPKILYKYLLENLSLFSPNFQNLTELFSIMKHEKSSLSCRVRREFRSRRRLFQYNFTRREIEEDGMSLFSYLNNVPSQCCGIHYAFGSP